MVIPTDSIELALAGAAAIIFVLLGIDDLLAGWQRHHQAKNRRLIEMATREHLQREAQMYEVATLLRAKAHEARKAMITEAQRAAGTSNSPEL